MNHPTNEEWMSYLYDETSAEQRANLAEHLRACPECSAKLAEWQTARKGLNAWRLRTRRTGVMAGHAGIRLAHPLLKWAAAAILMLSAGFVAGRLATAPVDLDQVRAAIEPEIRQQLRQELAQFWRAELDRTAATTLDASGARSRELLADYARALQAKQAEDNQAIFDAIGKLEGQHLADFVSLKKDLDTVAVYTDAGLRQAERQLVQLADYTRPTGN